MSATPRDVLIPQTDFFIREPDLKHEPPTEWFIDRLIPYGGVSLLFGPPNGGKSLVALDMAVRICKGKDWGGRVTKQSDVLYVATEGARPALRDRMSAWKELNQDDGEVGNLMFYTRDISILDSSPTRESDLKQIVAGTMNAGLWPEFIIIDTLNYAIDGDENDNNYMGRVAKFLSGLRTLNWHDHDGSDRELHPTVLLVHHTPKSNFDTARGASALEGAIDTSLRLVEVEGVSKLIEIYNKKNRYASKGSSWYYSIRDDDDGFVSLGAAVEYTSAEDVKVITASQQETAKIDLEKLLKKKPLRNKDMVTLLKAKGYTENVIEKARKELQVAGVIVKKDAHKFAPWVLVKEEYRE